jgi:hypothetical protein
MNQDISWIGSSPSGRESRQVIISLEVHQLTFERFCLSASNTFIPSDCVFLAGELL